MINITQRMNILNASRPVNIPIQVNESKQDLLKNLPKDFGPGHPLWKIPSYRQKWMIANGARFPQAVAKPANPAGGNPHSDRQKKRK